MIRAKYFYTQDAERPYIMYLDKYLFGITRTIAIYNDQSGVCTRRSKFFDDDKAFNDFVEYCRHQWVSPLAKFVIAPKKTQWSKYDLPKKR